MCEITSKLTIKTVERCQRRSGIFIVNLENISDIVLLFVDFGQVNTGCGNKWSLPHRVNDVRGHY